VLERESCGKGCDISSKSAGLSPLPEIAELDLDGCALSILGVMANRDSYRPGFSKFYCIECKNDDDCGDGAARCTDSVGSRTEVVVERKPFGRISRGGRGLDASDVMLFEGQILL
jgi:hypothetical protein